MTSLFFCWWHQIFSDHPIAAEMTSEHELQEPGNLGEVLLENSSPLNYGRSENFGSENCLILFVSTYKHMCKMHQNDGQMIWGSQFSRLLRTSHFGGHRRGCRPRNRPGFAPFVRQSRETASRWSRRLEWYGWEPEAVEPVKHTSGNQCKIEKLDTGKLWWKLHPCGPGKTFLSFLGGAISICIEFVNLQPQMRLLVAR